jgi:hypothetical protein
MTQRTRVYSLTIGDYNTGQGVLINDLQITFDIAKTSDNKSNNGNSASIDVYNLNREQSRFLETDFIEATLSVGYADEGTRIVVTGNVTEVSTRKKGTDRITTIKMGEAYKDLNHNKIKGSVAPGSTVRQAIDAIQGQMPNTSIGSLKGENMDAVLPGGFRLSGTPRENLRKLAEAFKFEYTITGGVLNTTDVNGLSTKDTTLCPVINVETGMIDEPFRTSDEAKKSAKDKRRRRGVQFKCLLNTQLIPGSIVRIESVDITGFYRINSVRFSGDFRGNDWTAECATSEVSDLELA